MQSSEHSNLDQHAAGRLIGSYRWIEKQLFHLLGGWTESVPASVKLLFDEQSFEFAWHADLWTDRLPDHRGLEPSAFTAAPNAATAAIFRELVDTSAISETVEKLSAVYRVILPRLIAAYSKDLNQTYSGGNNPTQRALRLILADEVTAWRAGEALLLAMLTDKEAICAASELQQRFELLLLESGGLTTLAT